MGFTTATDRWPGNRVPYEIASDILQDNFARNAVDAAIDEWNQRTGVTLFARTQGEPDYVIFRMANASCGSWVGRKSGHQFISCHIVPGSFAAGNVMHEIGHAVGFYHEQQRPDHSSFVAIDPSVASNTNYETQSGHLCTPFDCDSIMLYPPISGRISTVACPVASGEGSTGMGQRVQLSAGDIATVDSLSLDANPAADMIAAGNGRLFLKHNTGHIYQYDGSPNSWTRIDANSATRSITADGRTGDVFQLHSTGHIYQYNGSPNSWTRIDANPATNAIAAGGGNVFMKHGNGHIYQYDGTPDSWTRIDANAAARDIVADHNTGALFQRHNTGHIYQYDGSPNSWTRIDANSATDQVTADNGSVYLKHNTGHVYQYNGSPNSWTRIDANSATVDIVAAGPRVYLRHNTGHIYWYNGSSWVIANNNTTNRMFSSDGDTLYSLQAGGQIIRTRLT